MIFEGSGDSYPIVLELFGHLEISGWIIASHREATSLSSLVKQIRAHYEDAGSRAVRLYRKCAAVS